jgi:hypothetical protein
MGSITSKQNGIHDGGSTFNSVVPQLEDAVDDVLSEVSTSSDSTDDNEEVTRCVACLEFFDHDEHAPVCLPCSIENGDPGRHCVICRDCFIENYLPKLQTDKSIMCPVCKQTFYGVDQIHNAFELGWLDYPPRRSYTKTFIKPSKWRESEEQRAGLVRIAKTLPFRMPGSLLLFSDNRLR